MRRLVNGGGRCGESMGRGKPIHADFEFLLPQSNLPLLFLRRTKGRFDSGMHEFGITPKISV